ncbi:Ssk2-type MAP kinase [Microthyrium microscopicum]|uniref:MAP kinase kinase kinase n=1 Tax=Microthyrium microscopicum TaxID=703497 RepID=A0A6A6U9R9_9PEZI|nr:Ssk2-type MAP kinase [Microthyrium microscopicum]
MASALPNSHSQPTSAPPDLLRNESGDSSASTDSEVNKASSSDDDVDGQFDFTPAVVTTPLDDVPPMLSASTTYSWTSRGHGSSTSASPNGANDLSPITPMTPGLSNGIATRQQRPNAARTPSNAYAPYTARRPTQYSLNSNTSRGRNSSTTRSRKPNPNAEYRAQERAYVQRIRQDARESDGYVDTDLRTPSVDMSSDAGTDEGSPSTADVADDPYEQDTLLYYGNDEMQPSVEELKIPENRERLEWHSMLASVLRGDVVSQEKRRLVGGGDQNNDSTLRAEIWLGLRAKICGRPLQVHRGMVENGRAEIKTIIENIIGFEIQGVAEAGKTAAEQVTDMVKKIEKIEGLYPNSSALEKAHPRVMTPEFFAAYSAIIAWHNTMELINTELSILRKWVGNEELNFSLPRKREAEDGRLVDEASFIERILKEDGLKSLQSQEGLLIGLTKVIEQAKNTLIVHRDVFHERHLPPYIEELQTLINFPSRLVKELIRIRLSYAKKIKDWSQQPVMTTEQMIGQFQILLDLAVRIKDSYIQISRPEPGWDPSDCIEENFDVVVVDALKFYFKLLNWKLSANKNAFKEAEIMEQEWDFSTRVGRYLYGGDIEVAEQFSSLTSKSLVRLNTQFERELQKRPDELSHSDIDKRYKTMLDSVRVRQRKLFRFSRLLTQRFENSAEYNLNLDNDSLVEFYNSLIFSGHFLIDSKLLDDGIYMIGSPALQDRPEDIPSLLGTCYHAEDNPEDPTNPYVLILRPENTLFWAGKTMEMQVPPPEDLDLNKSRLRLVADGSHMRLATAKNAFQQQTGHDLSVTNEQRANLTRVNFELKKIKRTAFNLSNTIMSSVEIIRKQTEGMDCQELIQSCFAFATEFGQRSIHYMDGGRKTMNNKKLMKLALDWISFICDDCNPSDRKTFRWAVTALEFAMIMTQGQNILSMDDTEYSRLRAKVAGCMSLLVSHFDIMGARSTLAAQAEKHNQESMHGKHRMDLSNLQDESESTAVVRQKRIDCIEQLDDSRKQRDIEKSTLGRVLEDSNEPALRALTYLTSSSSNVHIRWQQGQFIGGGTFGSVYVAINLESNELMAVKEIRLHDPQLIPTIVSQIRDEMTVLQVLDHPNVVSYYGIEPHRDKVYIFMEYCDGGSLSALLEHGRIEDETVVMVYALQMLEGLAYLHERGIVHRDIKPENILLDHDGVIKFVDFGAAKVIARQGGKTLAAGVGAAADGNRQNSMQGTPMYMSPEVIRGANTGRLGSADIWSLGCVILEMATGRRPWASLDNEWAIMYNIAQGNTPQLPQGDQLTDLGIAFLDKCFDRDPVKRASAAELLQDAWIMTLRSQLSLEPATPVSESGSGTSSGYASRQNSAM